MVRQEKRAPMCSLHSVPHNVDHCLVCARSEFEGLLEKKPTEDDVTNYHMDLIAGLANMRQS
ncbi:hypothetical protein C5167_033664 [Papaver somniferum]|uniref:Uncharacterized protein n=1 Tax=Papaver somniferum TaxID=3469 RepID=A0A4Y7KBN6_PAPSO|nr:hypothetical protein C5167_033664 [Papaver somniferum]